MKPNLLAIVLAAILFGGAFYFYRGGSPASAPATDAGQTTSSSSAQNQENASTATNYEECIAEGNQPLPDSPDKCLTKDGHIFIEGVVE